MRHRLIMLYCLATVIVLAACFGSGKNGLSSNHPLNDYSVEVYQYVDNDSSNKYAVKHSVYKNGKLISETYNGFKTGSRDGYANGSYFYFYRDTMLVKRQGYTEFNGDSTRSVYAHNADGSLATEMRYDFSRPIKKTSKGRDNLTEDDYEAIGTWSKSEELRYSYDDLGRKSSMTTIKDSTRPRRHVWSYDGKNRIIACAIYVGGQIDTKEDYVYTENSILFKLIDLEFGVAYQTVRTFDAVGRVISETGTIPNDEFIHTVKNTYDQNGQITKSVIFDSQDSITITHLFEYNRPAEPQ